jgi:processive 1,2-diacylglycerol beta-glucosyltransferase
MPQERLTLKYFYNGAHSRIVKNENDFTAIIDEWMTNPAAYPAYREQFHAARYEEDPTIVIDELVTLASEAAPSLPPPKRASFPPANGNGMGVK